MNQPTIPPLDNSTPESTIAWAESLTVEMLEFLIASGQKQIDICTTMDNGLTELLRRKNPRPIRIRERREITSAFKLGTSIANLARIHRWSIAEIEDVIRGETGL